MLPSRPLGPKPSALLLSYTLILARLVGNAPTASGFGIHRIASTQTHKLLKKNRLLLWLAVVECFLLYEKTMRQQPPNNLG